MSLINTVETDFLHALKEKNKTELTVLRMLKSALKNQEIATKKTLEDFDVLKVLKSEVKQRKESIESFQSADREDLVSQEKAELEILQKYLPAEMSDEELREKVSAVIDSLSDDAKSNFGLAMGQVMKTLSGQADGGRINAIVKELLS